MNTASRGTRHTIVALTTLALLLGVMAPAQATSAFQFRGSGWGHGVGMSQYGALEQARDGRTAEQIIAHYYQGATAEKRSLGLGKILVGLSQDNTSVTATAKDAGITVQFDGKDFDVPKGGTASFQFLNTGGKCRLRINGSNAGYHPDCDADLTPKKGASIALSNESVVYSHGRITKLRLRPRPSKPKFFHVAAELPGLKKYLYGLREVPASWPTQTLRAQAIAARSFAAYDLLGGGFDGEGCHCHLYDSVRSQVYGGSTGETAAWRNAVDSTDGKVVHAPGEDGTRSGVVQAFYSSSSGGRTEAIEDSSAFGAGPRSYFSSVKDPWSLRSSNPYAYWTIDVPESAIRSKLGFDDVTSIAVTARNESGSARVVTFNGRRGTKSVSATTTGDQLRGLLGLRSGYISTVFLPPFIDDDGHVHESSIAWMADQGYTSGCNPPTNNRYCPEDPVTRAQMATFLARVLGLKQQSEDFVDVADDDTHAGSIGALAASGITKGCNPPQNDRFCPNEPVTRAQMATFILRAKNLKPRSENFVDVADDDTHAKSIGALAYTGITQGCNPPKNDRFCPDDRVTRAQMATFIKRMET